MLKITLAAIAAVTLSIVGAVTWLGTARVAYTGQCILNGRPIAACHCMAGAYAETRTRKDLPPIYAELAKSWAYDVEAEYRSKVYSTVFWQSVRAVPVVRDVLMGAPAGSAETVWDRMTRKLGEVTLQQISQRLGIAIVPMALKAKAAKEALEPGWDFAKAHAIVTKHCGGRTHQIVSNIEKVNAQVADQIEIFKATLIDVAQRSLEPVAPIAKKISDGATSIAQQGKALWARVYGWATRSGAPSP